ncbi:MAG: proton-conducting membrane transporter [Lachnospiraceae bacterium]|nr:proton-conducting membrane transporter [Lachnospiraceae bacterium]
MLILLIMMLPAAAGIAAGAAKLSEGKVHRVCAGTLLLTDLIALILIIRGGSLKLFGLTEQVSIAFRIDAAARIFLLAVMILYTAVLFYAFEYMHKEERIPVFFAFYMISYGAMLGVCMSQNLVTLYLCFEFATLSTVPLVLHEMHREAVQAGLKYLFYSVGGALMGLLGVFFLTYYGKGDTAFVIGGFLDPARTAGHEKLLLWVIMISLIGFGTKAGMFPMHGWLPSAHPIAPAPASALLSGIIAKAGIIAVIRLIFFSAGADLIRGTWVQTAWMVLAMITIFMGSMMAFKEKIMKKRLAYSTVSQISYIMLGLSFLSPAGIGGAFLHLFAHMASKGCLFLCAGAVINRLGYREVKEYKGLGEVMPVTMFSFFLASMSLVGIPPFGGFASKWYLAAAAIGSDIPGFRIAAPVILLVSALLTAGYLFPVMVEAFFPGEEYSFMKERGGKISGDVFHKGKSGRISAEPTGRMLIPMLVLVAVSLCAGMFGSQIVSLIQTLIPVAL